MKRQLTLPSTFSVFVATVAALALGVAGTSTAAERSVGAASAPICASPKPLLYHNPQYQSPVRGDPGDVLLIPGVDFTPQTLVVYQGISDTTQPLVQPGTLPHAGRRPPMGMLTRTHTVSTRTSLPLLRGVRPLPTYCRHRTRRVSPSIRGLASLFRQVSILSDHRA